MGAIHNISIYYSSGLGICVVALGYQVTYKIAQSCKASYILTGLAVALHVRGPEREVVPQQLHDECGVLVALLGQRVELGDRVVERRLRQPTRAVRTVQDFVVEYLQTHRVTVTTTRQSRVFNIIQLKIV